MISMAIKKCEEKSSSQRKNGEIRTGVHIPNSS
jgi:hypothetical protein